MPPEFPLVHRFIREKMKKKRTKASKQKPKKPTQEQTPVQLNIDSYHTEKNWRDIEAGLINQLFLSDTRGKANVERILVNNLLPFINPNIPKNHQISQAQKAVKKIFLLAQDVSRQVTGNTGQKSNEQIFLVEQGARKVIVSQLLLDVVRRESSQSRKTWKKKMDDLKKEKRIFNRFLKELKDIIVTHNELWIHYNALTRSGEGFLHEKDIFATALDETEKRLQTVISILEKRIKNEKQDLLPHVNAISIGTLPRTYLKNKN